MFRRLGTIMRISTLVLGGATALLYVGLGWLSYSLISGLDILESEHRLLAAGNALYAGLLKHDTGLKGYTLTGDPAFLDVQADGKREITKQVNGLASLTTLNTSQREKVETIHGLLQARYSQAESLIPRRHEAPKVANGEVESILIEAGKTNEAISRQIAELTAESEHWRAVVTSRSKEVLWIFWLVLGFGALVLAWSTVYFWTKARVLVAQGERAVHEASEAAYHDALTGLPNRRLLDRRIDAALARHSPGQNLALLMLDLDGFKAVNDALGHAAGDELLQMVGHRLRRAVRSRDLVVRHGGDEFVVFVEKYEDRAEVRELGQRLLATISERVDIAGESLRVYVSIGVCFVDENPPNLADMLRCADRALYAAKRAGKGRVVEYKAPQ